MSIVLLCVCILSSVSYIVRLIELLGIYIQQGLSGYKHGDRVLFLSWRSRWRVKLYFTTVYRLIPFYVIRMSILTERLFPIFTFLNHLLMQLVLSLR